MPGHERCGVSHALQHESPCQDLLYRASALFSDGQSFLLWHFWIERNVFKYGAWGFSCLPRLVWYLHWAGARKRISTEGGQGALSWTSDWIQNAWNRMQMAVFLTWSSGSQQL